MESALRVSVETLSVLAPSVRLSSIVIVPPALGRVLSPPQPGVWRRFKPVREGTDIQSKFFDMWRQEHADVKLEEVPSDMVMASGSGLDPHITLDNALFQLDRVAAQWAKDTNRDPAQVRREIQTLLEQSAQGGWVGPKVVNVLEVNLALRERYGAPAA